MKLHRIFATTATCALLIGAFSVSALAHGGHGYRRTTGTTAYPVCTVENCTEAYRHDHDGVTYCGHNSADGHAQCAAVTTTTTTGHGCGMGRGQGRCR